MSFDINTMLQPDVYPHEVADIELLETHISWVVLTGEFAYKIKKPVDFGFLDFSTLQKRKQYCEQELFLNRRLAPDIYLEVVAIGNTPQSLCILGAEEDTAAIEYAVKMQQFPQSAQLDNMLNAGELDEHHIDALAQMVAEFHQETSIAEMNSAYGATDLINKPVTENFAHIKKSPALKADTAKVLDELQRWSRDEFKLLEAVFAERKHGGFIRECHGDMHLGNLLWLDNKPLAFDCIEFNPELRWIDVISEIAFLVMDLEDRGQLHLAHRFLDRYLQITGDYAGLQVLPFYLCYRAMVRAKVDILRLEQITSDAGLKSEQEDSETVEADFLSYVDLAQRYSKAAQAKIILMRGLSASGKSTVSQQLLEETGAIRIRSDVERKRLFNIPIDESASSGVDQGIYSREASERTYDRLMALSSTIISAGYSVILDAAFLQYERRQPFELLAQYLAVPYIILEVSAPYEVLRQRIIARKNDVSDANLAVLEQQISQWKALRDDEINHAVNIDTTKPVDIMLLIHSINKKTRINTGNHS